MERPGLEAFERRSEERSGGYSYERAQASLGRPERAAFRANEKAWAFFEAQAPSYRRAAIWWVVSAKRDETRRRRLETLIRCSAQGELVPPLRR
jgi:uncharacterized protein YdeI (YjbR/CyaY-like superfamily)